MDLQKQQNKLAEMIVKFGKYSTLCTRPGASIKSNIECDLCHKQNLQKFWNYDKGDLCLDCVNLVIEKLKTEPLAINNIETVRPIPEAIGTNYESSNTKMQQNIYKPRDTTTTGQQQQQQQVMTLMQQRIYSEEMTKMQQDTFKGTNKKDVVMTKMQQSMFNKLFNF